jgi:hypothetical protein
MAYRYSRRTRTEEKRNVRKAFLYVVLTLILIIAFFFFGLPTVVKFAALLTELKTSKTPVETTDTTPPPPPKLDSLPSFTNELSVEIEGSTEPGVTVLLFLNNKKEELLSDSEGEFSYTFMLNDGENKISAIAVDNSGNESQKTDVQKVTYDNDPPELEVIKPDDGANFYGAKERQVVIEGTTEEGASININGRQIVVEPDGSFAFATTLSEGENSFTIKSEDQAKNSTELSLTVSFTP